MVGDGVGLEAVEGCGYGVLEVGKAEGEDLAAVGGLFEEGVGELQGVGVRAVYELPFAQFLHHLHVESY